MRSNTILYFRKKQHETVPEICYRERCDDDDLEE